MTDSDQYSVGYDTTARKELGKLDRQIAKRVARAVSVLGHNPRPAGCRRLVGYDDLWRIRVGDYQVVVAIRDTELIVLALRIAHRSDVYRRMAMTLRQPAEVDQALRAAAAEEHRSVQQEVVHAIEDYLARRETQEVKSDPEALRALAEARESVRAGDVVYGAEAARALV